MIHLALWIASALFLIWFACLIIPLFLAILWKCRWIIGGAVLLFVLYAGHMDWFPQTTSQSVSSVQPQTSGDSAISGVIVLVLLGALLLWLKLGSKNYKAAIPMSTKPKQNRRDVADTEKP